MDAKQDEQTHAATPSTTSAAEQPDSGATSDMYTAVIFFHGMGSQRRYGEVSNLVEDLEAYDEEVAPKERGRWMIDIEAKLEPARTRQRKPIPFIETKYIGPRFDKRDSRVYRFYEAYWAPVTAGGVPMHEVFWWLLRQVKNPWRALGSPWRSRARYRISILYELVQRTAYQSFTDGDGKDGVLREVLAAYDGFEQSQARRAYKQGSFLQFYQYLRDREWTTKKKHTWTSPEFRAYCLKLARAWYRNYIVTELRTAIILVSLLVAMLTTLIVLVAATVGLITTIPFTEISSSTWGLVLSVITFILAVVGVRTFFQDYLGDVVFWTTYEEADQRYQKREEILQVGYDLLRHVVRDTCCRRVIVVAHSLGTTVAYESLMELGRYNRARRAPHEALLSPLPLNKIEYFITYGSPIDKIHYFFQNETNEMHRYHRVLEDIRGDINQVPLAHNHKPHAHWINFWDQADIISGSLQSPLPLVLDYKPKRYLRVDDVQVSNGSLFPARSHGTYTRNPEVIQIIYECIFKRKYAFFPADRHQVDWRPHYHFLTKSFDDQRAKRFHYGMIVLFWLAPCVAAGVGGLGLFLTQPRIALLAPQLPTLMMSPQQWVWQILLLALLVPIIAGVALLSFWVRAQYDLVKVERQLKREQER